ncbi:hypothetical protein MMMB2_5336 [Mycobacterium marinum MB2]|nr:hypothetical protein MMMB2_5336 [Mycobacterium marinum MB2]
MHPPQRDAQRNPVGAGHLAIGLAAARDGASRDGRLNSNGHCHLPVISLRRHYPVRFLRSTASSRPLSAVGVRSRVR